MVSGVALGGVAAFLLRAARRDDRSYTVAGWLALGAMVASFALAMGAETGIPTALAALSVLVLVLVWSSAERRDWRAKMRSPADELTPARRENAWWATSRWLAAGPLAFISAVLASTALAAPIGGENEDTLILAMTASVIAWACAAAWAFSTRKPLRAMSLIAVIGVVGAACIAAPFFA